MARHPSEQNRTMPLRPAWCGGTIMCCCRSFNSLPKTPAPPSSAWSRHFKARTTPPCRRLAHISDMDADRLPRQAPRGGPAPGDRGIVLDMPPGPHFLVAGGIARGIPVGPAPVGPVEVRAAVPHDSASPSSDRVLCGVCFLKKSPGAVIARLLPIRPTSLCLTLSRDSRNTCSVLAGGAGGPKVHYWRCGMLRGGAVLWHRPNGSGPRPHPGRNWRRQPRNPAPCR